MIIPQIYKNKRTRAQAMVEFALVIPLLLLLVYGLLETGRLLFIYASTISAAREAARYGMATGDSPSGVPYYQDCAGIRSAAKKVGFINRFNDVDIVIKYDGGLDSASGTVNAFSPVPTCPNYSAANNGDRIVVSVSTDWVPVVPFLPLRPFRITSVSERSILASIEIKVTAMPLNSGALVLAVSPNLTTYSSKDTVVTLTFTLTNSPSATAALTGPFSVATTVHGVATTTTCAGAPATLAIGASFTCAGTYSYVTTQDDMDIGSFSSSSVGSATGSTSAAVPKTFTGSQFAALSLTVSANPTVASNAGDVIAYTYRLTNTGNVSLTSPFAITDNKVAGVSCAGAASPLKPGDPSVTCTGTYIITAGDVTAGSVANNATATALFGATTVTSAPASATVLTKALILTVSPTSASPFPASAPNQVVTYNYTITNNSGGTVTLTGVTDNKATVGASCVNKPIISGGNLSCTGTYTITAADYAANVAISSTATASATTSGGTTITSGSVTTTIPVTQVQAISVTVASVTPSQPAGSMIAGTTTITYVYSLKNAGNVTLVPTFTVNDGVVTTCASIVSIVAPNSANCTVVYTVTQADIDAGLINKTITASGFFGATIVTSPSITSQIFTVNIPRFSVSVSGAPNPITQVGNITYTYTIKNTGNSNFSAPYNITASGTGFTGPISCAGAISPLPPGASTTCTSTKAVSTSGTYTVTVTAASVSGASNDTLLPLSTSVIAGICSISNLIFVNPNTLGNSNQSTTFTIRNSVGVSLSISSIEFVFDNASPAKTFDAMTLGGVSIPASGASYPYAGPSINIGSPTFGPWTIGIGDTALKFTFSKSGMNISSVKVRFANAGCGPLTY